MNIILCKFEFVRALFLILS